MKRVVATCWPRHLFPGVIGPKHRHYIIDHHHLGLALLREGVAKVRLSIEADFSKLAKGEFWMALDYRQWVHPFDGRGRKRPFSALPRSLAGLVDDPFRSLVAAVRMSGGIAKDQRPFAEFVWADFFRRRISRVVLQRNPGRALGEAMALVHDKSAAHLPGWCGAGSRPSSSSGSLAASLSSRPSRQAACAPETCSAACALRRKAPRPHRRRPPWLPATCAGPP